MTERVNVFDDDFKQLRPSTGLLGKVISLIAISYFFLEVLALQFVVIDIWVFMTLVMIAVMILGFLTIPSSAKKHRKGKEIRSFLDGHGRCSMCLYSYRNGKIAVDVWFNRIVLRYIFQHSSHDLAFRARPARLWVGNTHYSTWLPRLRILRSFTPP
jgi:hypothetical protein